MKGGTQKVQICVNWHSEREDDALEKNVEEEEGDEMF